MFARTQFCFVLFCLVLVLFVLVYVCVVCVRACAFHLRFVFPDAELIRREGMIGILPWEVVSRGLTDVSRRIEFPHAELIHTERMIGILLGGGFAGPPRPPPRTVPARRAHSQGRVGCFFALGGLSGCPADRISCTKQCFIYGTREQL